MLRGLLHLHHTDTGQHKGWFGRSPVRFRDCCWCGGGSSPQPPFAYVDTDGGQWCRIGLAPAYRGSTPRQSTKWEAARMPSSSSASCTVQKYREAAQRLHPAATAALCTPRRPG